MIGKSSYVVRAARANVSPLWTFVSLESSVSISYLPVPCSMTARAAISASSLTAMQSPPMRQYTTTRFDVLATARVIAVDPWVYVRSLGVEAPAVPT